MSLNIVILRKSIIILKLTSPKDRAECIFTRTFILDTKLRFLFCLFKRHFWKCFIISATISNFLIYLSFMTNIRTFIKSCIIFTMSKLSTSHKQSSNKDAKKHRTCSSQGRKNRCFHTSFSWIFSYNN